MNFALIVLFLATCLFSISGFGQNRVGNGGDGIVCTKEGAQATAEILDFYESSQARIESTEAYSEIVESRLQVLKKIDSTMGELYQKRWKSMQPEIEWKKEIELIGIEDSKHLYVPSDKNCKLKQVAIRRNQVAANQSRFVIDDSFWQQISPVSRAGLIMHELIYEHFYKLGEKDSVKARTLNAYIFSPDLESKGSTGFWKLISSLKVPIYRN